MNTKSTSLSRPLSERIKTTLRNLMNTLFWFRRDLRLFNNDALYQAIENGCQMLYFLLLKSNGKNMMWQYSARFIKT